MQQNGLQVPEFALETDGPATAAAASQGLKLEPVEFADGTTPFVQLSASGFHPSQTPASVAATGTIESSDGSASNDSSSHNISE